jgi:glycosyltransferase involved in cell wall biosynthesis
MPATDTVPARPVVSVIVPARNEEACLAACLQSLVAQDAVPLEIIVVDDQSTDRTRAIASSFPRDRVQVIEAGEVPPGWTGKNNAVTTGSKAARGEWLLFTDADTIHRPGSLARSLDEANRQHAALLSYSPEQIVKGFWEKAVMPVIFAELAASFRPSQVSDPNSPAAAANGQYILITREAYDAVGGHAAIATSLLEDVALARAVKQSGRTIFFRYGGDAVQTRMYRSFAQLREGWTKNLALLFPHPVSLAARSLLEFLVTIAFANALVQILFFGRSYLPSASLLLPHYPLNDRTALLFGRWMTTVAMFGLVYCLSRSVWRTVKAHFPLRFSGIAILGLPVFSYLLLRSFVIHQRGGVTWKGRKYSLRQPEVSTSGFKDRIRPVV